MYVCMYVYMYVCMYVCMYVYILYIYTHIIHTRTYIRVYMPIGTCVYALRNQAFAFTGLSDASKTRRDILWRRMEEVLLMRLRANFPCHSAPESF